MCWGLIAQLFHVCLQHNTKELLLETQIHEDGLVWKRLGQVRTDCCHDPRANCLQTG
jgi:hypothetical protein